MNLERLKRDLMRHEGVRLRPYRDTVGKLTIGVGRNLDDVGITRNEAMYLLEADIQHLLDSVIIQNIIEGHDSTRQEVILNMAFNLGIQGLLEFKNMLRAFNGKDYEGAAREMMDSRWARQVKRRAVELAEHMRTGI